MASVSAQPVPGTLAVEERDALLQMLHSSRDAVVQATAALTEHQATSRPAAEAWSIIDCVEHLAVSDETILSLVLNEIMHSPADPDCRMKTEGKTELVTRVMRDYTEERKAPSYLEPTRRWTTLDEALKAFQDNRERSIEYVLTTEAKLHLHTAPLPALGDLSGYQWLVLMATHTDRHIVQIQNLRRQSEQIIVDA